MRRFFFDSGFDQTKHTNGTANNQREDLFDSLDSRALDFRNALRLDFLKPLKFKICIGVLHKGPGNRQINKTSDSQSEVSGRDAMNVDIVNVSLGLIISFGDGKKSFLFFLLLMIFLKHPR